MAKLLGNPRFLRLMLVLSGSVILLTLSETLPLLEFWKAAFHEVGFALLVSFIVWSMFEFHMAQEADSEWTRRIERVAQNVFFAVLRKDLPKELIDEARALALDTSIIRASFNVTYTLRDATFEVTPGEQADCVLMVAVIAFDVRNISAEAINVPIGVALPNPVHPNLKALTRVNSLTVRNQSGDVPLDLGAADAEFRARLDADLDTAIKYDAGTVPLAPGESIQVRADYVMAKEPEDTELLQTIYPCDGLTVTVMDTSVDQRRLMFAKAVHRRVIENQSSADSPGTKIFRIPGYLLPHQGVLIWWKRAPIGAQQELPGLH